MITALSVVAVVAGVVSAAGSIAMGLGGYLAARSAAKHYHAERAREETEVREKPRWRGRKWRTSFAPMASRRRRSSRSSTPFANAPRAWVDFMMRLELGLEKPEPRRALASALTIAAAYIVGGFIPLGPYMAMKATGALAGSVGIALVALAIFGYVKGHFTGASPVRGSLQTVLIGGLAAAAAFAIARAIS